MAAGKRKRPLGAEFAAVDWPEQFLRCTLKDDCRWIVLKVDADIDWRGALDGAQLHLGPPAEDPAGAAARAAEATLRPPKGPTPRVALRAVVERDHWNVHLPLCPVEAGSHKLVAQQAAAIVRFFRRGQASERAADATRETEARETVIARRRAAATQELMDTQRRKKWAEKRYALTPLSSLLALLGAEGRVDASAARSTAAEAAARAGEPGEAAGAAAAAADAECLHLKALPAGGSKHCAPIVLWNVSHLARGTHSKLSFRRYAVRGRHKLTCRHRGASLTQFEGWKAKAKGHGTRWLLGAKTEGSKRVFLVEAEVYNFQHAEVSMLPESAPSTALPFGEQRGKVIGEMGTAKKQRMSKIMRAKVMREHRVVDLAGGQFSAELAARAQELEKREITIEDRDKGIKADLLPPYDVNAAEPWGIYREGLQMIAPARKMILEPSLVDKDIVKLLMTDPRKLTAIASQFVDACRFKLTHSIILARARAGVQLTEKDEATKMAMRFGVLNCLLVLVTKASRWRRGRVIPKSLAEMFDLPPDSLLVKHWHKTYYDDIPGSRLKRAYNYRRTICALMIWALHLTPSLSLEFSTEVDKELGLGAGILKTCLTYLGCTVEYSTAERSTNAVMTATLTSPPTLNRAKYEVQTRHGSGNKSKRRHGR